MWGKLYISCTSVTIRRANYVKIFYEVILLPCVLLMSSLCSLENAWKRSDCHTKTACKNKRQGTWCHRAVYTEFKQFRGKQGRKDSSRSSCTRQQGQVARSILSIRRGACHQGCRGCVRNGSAGPIHKIEHAVQRLEADKRLSSNSKPSCQDAKRAGSVFADFCYQSGKDDLHRHHEYRGRGVSRA